MTKLRLFIPVLALSVLVMWAACTTQRSPCLTPKTASLIMESVHLPTDTSTTTIDTALPYAVFIPVTAHIDTVAYLLSSFFTISLSPDSSVCQWRFCTDSQSVSFYDTLTFLYQKNLNFLSNACGYTYFYTLDSVHSTHHFVDSIHILNTSVTNNVNTRQLQIYIHPDY